MPVVLGTPRVERAAPETRLWPRGAIQLLALAGFVLLVVSWTHLFNAFNPAMFGVAPWEYAVTTQSVDIMPLGIMGSALVAAAALISGWRKRLYALSVLGVVTSLVLAGMAMLIVLDLPIAWSTVTADRHQDLIESASKSLLFIALFITYYLWMARLTWRAARTGSDG